MSITKLINKNIRKLKPYSSARDEFQGKVKIYLDANENNYGLFNRYPDPDQNFLRKRLAKILQVSFKNICVSNGSDEAIDWIIRIFCKPFQDNILLLEPGYEMYKVVADINNIQTLKVKLNTNFDLNLKQIFKTFNKQTKVIFLTSPNNPTGNLLSADKIRLLLKSFSGIIVIDEAYIEFVKVKSWVKLVHQYPNLIVLRTFSKAWGLAGIRLGYVVASQKIISFCKKIKMPYNTSVLSCETALQVLENYKQVRKNIGLILKQREWLKQELVKLKIVKQVYPSKANFLLIKFISQEKAVDVWEYLKNNGIIVRDRTKQPNLRACLRISVGTKQENQCLIKTLKNFKTSFSCRYKKINMVNI